MQTYAQVGLFVVCDSKTLQCGSLCGSVAISLQVPFFPLAREKPLRDMLASRGWLRIPRNHKQHSGLSTMKMQSRCHNTSKKLGV